ncbi:MAG: ABC transporter ATP-binding protein [bacterium]
MPIISIDGITKQVDGKRILDNVTLKIEDRSFTCILGSPGAGKTTLLRIIAGLEPPTEGTIYFDHQDVTDLYPQKRGVSMVFQDFALYPHLTVYDNISSPLKAVGSSKEEMDQRVKEVSDFLKIADLLERKPEQLSGGEMQRVAIARALAKRPRICLFDEPLVNLDYKIREGMRAEFKLCQEKLGQTIIYATPDPVDALAMADKVAILNNGKVEQYTEVDEAYNHPATVFVGTYLGYPAMNVIKCGLVEKEEKLLLNARSFTLDVTALKDELKSSAKEVVLGIRPEHISISEEPLEGMDASLEAKIVVGEVIGSDTIVHLRLGEHLLKAFVPEIYRAGLGKTLWISFNLSDVHLFDGVTSKIII